ncbi:hypothetical protein [Chamaesiphon sp. VAR_69_metabat_338]|nr:hypothetical protein [Chamaesiphon sp. VAR_69_metabat_338]
MSPNILRSDDRCLAAGIMEPAHIYQLLASIDYFPQAAYIYDAIASTG